MEQNSVATNEIYLTTSSLEGGVKDTLNLYECTLENPPERVEDPRAVKIGKVITNFDGVPSSKIESRWNSKLKAVGYKFCFQVQISFRADSGVLEFKSTAYGSEKGRTTVKFNRDS
jgi:hypothetical protein